MKQIGRFRAVGIAAVTLAILAAAVASQALGGSKDGPASAKGLGPLTGLLPRDHLTEESAIQVDLSKESVRLPLYKGKANGETVWFVLLDASDQGTRTIWASTTRPSSATSRSAPRRRCRR